MAAARTKPSAAPKTKRAAPAKPAAVAKPASAKSAKNAESAKSPKPSKDAGAELAPKPHRIFGMSFGSVYVLYVKKAEGKGRTKAEVDQVISWLTGYDAKGLARVLEEKTTFETFFAEAPQLNPNVGLITGLVCGVRVEEVPDPLMRKIRYLDKLVDELARGKKMASILRQ